MTEYTYTDIFLDSGSVNNMGSRDTPLFNLVPSVRNAEAMAIMAVTIPFSYFVIDATNNTIQVTLPAVADSVYTIYLVNGTYTVAEFVTMFNSVINIEYDSTKPYNGGVSVTGGTGQWDDLYALGDGMKAFVYGTTNIITIYTGDTATGNNTFDFDLDFTGATSAYQSMGFRQTTYGASQATIYTDSDTTITNVYYVEAPFTVSMTGPGYIYIQSDLAAQVKDGACRTERTTASILTAIRVNNNYTGMISYVNSYPQPLFFSKSDLTKVQLSLQLGARTSYCPGFDSSYYSSTGQPLTTSYLQLMGQPWQIQLRFYSKMETSMSTVMNPVTGDRFTSTQSAHNGAMRPSEQIFQGRDVTADMRGMRVPGINPDRSTQYPIRAPTQPRPGRPTRRRRIA